MRSVGVRSMENSENFEIIKEWFGEKGTLTSRLIRCFYKGAWNYALDYNCCKESVDITVVRSPLGLRVSIPAFIPKRYLREVPSLILSREAQTV